MKNILTILITLCSLLHAEQCTLTTYASSWMATGTPFSVSCPSGDHSGTIVASPARRLFRRGHLMLKFNEPLAIQTKDAEGVFKPGRKQQVASLLLSGGAGIGAKDLTDGLSGAIFRSYYMIPITVGAVALFEKGGDVNLKPGDKITVIGSRK